MKRNTEAMFVTFIILLVGVTALLYFYNTTYGYGQSIAGTREYAEIMKRDTIITTKVKPQQEALLAEGREQNEETALCALVYNPDFQSYTSEYVPQQYWYRLETDLERKNKVLLTFEKARKVTATGATTRGPCSDAKEWSETIFSQY